MTRPIFSNESSQKLEIQQERDSDPTEIDRPPPRCHTPDNDHTRPPTSSYRPRPHHSTPPPLKLPFHMHRAAIRLRSTCTNVSLKSRNQIQLFTRNNTARITSSSSLSSSSNQILSSTSIRTFTTTRTIQNQDGMSPLAQAQNPQSGSAPMEGVQSTGQAKVIDGTAVAQ